MRPSSERALHFWEFTTLTSIQSFLNWLGLFVLFLHGVLFSVPGLLVYWETVCRSTMAIQSSNDASDGVKLDHNDHQDKQLEKATQSTHVSEEATREGPEAVRTRAEPDPEAKQEAPPFDAKVLTGLPFILLILSLVLATWLVALNATVIGTVSSRYLCVYCTCI